VPLGVTLQRAFGGLGRILLGTRRGRHVAKKKKALSAGPVELMLVLQTGTQ
jgi:hypothetical protein